LNLNIDKANRILGWRPVWDFEEAVARTVSWYCKAHEGEQPLALTRAQIDEYYQDAAAKEATWAR
jgi:CDP-glucose 4,6-dehydratase